MVQRTVDTARAEAGEQPPAGPRRAPDAGAQAVGANADVVAPRGLPPPRPIEELLAELDALIGLAEVKREVHLVTNLLRVQQIRRERNLPVLEASRHLVFTGNPGTGKTTVARLLAQIYRTLGVVERGHLVETDRSGLVAGFVGQTAGKVVAAFDRADQGVLLIDEAYSLTRGGESDFGREAIDMVVKLVEDRRDRLVVILAGYPDEMEELIDANPGMRSRFPKTIYFPDYSDDELLAIVESLGAAGRYHLDDGARGAVRAWFAAQPRTAGFGNGRLARNLFEAAVANQASRLVAIERPTDEQLTTLTADDIAGPADAPEPRA
jgi:SpoVK/Ycf46/Vps4 family AAA+-type ATPase